MGPDGAVNIIYREEIGNANDPDARRAELIADYQERFTNHTWRPTAATWTTSSTPAATRPTIIRALEMLQNKRDTLPAKKHATYRYNGGKVTREYEDRAGWIGIPRSRPTGQHRHSFLSISQSLLPS